MSNYESIDGGLVPIKAWTRGVPVEDLALNQLRQTASLPIVGPHLAVMPDVHWGMGATVGSVVPTRSAVVPAAVGVDLGCGMTAVETPWTSSVLGDSGKAIFEAISKHVPHGRTDNGGKNDRGARGEPDAAAIARWRWSTPEGAPSLSYRYERLCERHPWLETDRVTRQLGTLGTGNHFVEVCLDERDHVWLMLHSGSRGIGNRIGSHFIAEAKRRCEREGIVLPNRDLAWLPEGTPEFGDYIEAVGWAQDYARANRDVMMEAVMCAVCDVVPASKRDGDFASTKIVSCHHNYVSRESHFNEDLIITRKGAVSARAGELGIIPGAMGRASFIVRGKGNADSFHSCSHGAGRVMSRGAAKKAITLEQHAADTAGTICRQDAEVLDESPRAYKDLSAVMSAQADLVDVVHELRAVVCVKG